MGEATDRKVAEIAATRSTLEADLSELESRLPAYARSAKSLVGLFVGGTALAAFLLQRTMGRRSKKPKPTEVVIRVVREDA